MQISDPMEPPLDLHGGAQEQVLDLKRGEFRVAHALSQARDPHQGQAEAAGAGDEHVRMRLRHQGARGRHQAADVNAALVEVLDHVVEIREGAEHRHAADGLPQILAPVGQDAPGLGLLHRPRFDGPQEHLDVAAAPEQQGRGAGVALQGMAGAGVFHVAEGQPRTPEERHLNQPVEGDRDLAEEVEPEELRRDKHVIGDQKREGQHGGGAEDVGQVGQGGEAPLGAVELEVPVDQPGEDHEGRQEQGQVGQALVEAHAVEAHEEGRENGRRRHHEIMHDDQRFLEVLPSHEPCQTMNGVSAGPMPLSM